MNLEIVNFLDKAGLQNAIRQPLAGDASHRRYERIVHKNQQYMLMVAPPEKEDVRPFIKVDKILREAGLNAPEILAEDVTAGLLLLEDFGDNLYSKTLREGAADEQQIYDYAVNVLPELPKRTDIAEYSAQKLLDETALLTDWLLTDASRDEYLEIWQEILAELDNSQQILVLRDYHADNLIWLPQRKDLQKVGLLDFQDAVMGHPAYDLVSLLEDARRDVSPAVVQKILQNKSKNFLKDYYILGAQRNCKIIGIFHRLKKRDGKDNYLKFLPRVWAHLHRDLEHPVLAPMKKWIEKNVADGGR